MTNDYTLCLKGAYLELTSRCNAKCPYCYNESNNGHLDELSLEAIYAIIDELSESDFPAVVFSGGEPFMYSYISQVLCYALSKNVKPTIITNGMLLERSRIKELLSENISLQLTFDSVIASEHDETRGIGNFEKLKEILLIANELSCEDKLMIRYNVNTKNYGHLETFIDFLLGYNIHSATFSFLHKTGRGKNYPFVLDLYEDSVLLYKILQDYRDKKKSLLKTLNFDLTFGELDNVLGCAYFADGKIEVSPRVDARGNIYPCQIFAGVENSLGNIFDFHSLTEILGSAGCHMVIDRIRNRKEKLKRKCCVCPYDDFCMGGCPATAFNQTGNLEAVDNQCYFIKYCFKNRYNFFETDTRNMEKCHAG